MATPGGPQAGRAWRFYTVCVDSESATRSRFATILAPGFRASCRASTLRCLAIDGHMPDLSWVFDSCVDATCTGQTIGSEVQKRQSRWTG